MSAFLKKYFILTLLVAPSLYALSGNWKEDSLKLEKLDSLVYEVTFRDTDSALTLIWNGLHRAQKLDCPDSVREYFISNFYFRMGNAFQIKEDYVLSIEYFYRSINIYFQIKRYALAADCYHQIGYAYMMMDNFTDALENFKYSLIINRFYKDDEASKNLINMGNCYVQLGQYQEALAAFLESLKIKIKQKDKTGITNCYVNIGAVQYILKNYNDALGYYFKALENFKADTNLLGQGQVYNNIGLIYMGQKKYDMADEAYKSALEIYRKINKPRKEGATLNNIGKNAFLQEKFDLALKYYTEYKVIAEKLNDKSSLAYVYQNLGSIDRQKKNYSKALDEFFISLKILEEVGQVHSKDQIYLGIAETYALNGNYKKSTEWYNEYVLLRDSLFSAESQNQMNEMEKKFQGERKQKEIEIQQEQLKRQQAEIDIQAQISENQRVLRNALIIGLVLCLFIVFLVYRSYVQKKRTNMILTQQKEEIQAQRDKLADLNNELTQKNEEISAQRDEIETQRDLLDIRNKQVEKVNREITDSIRYAKRIQGAIMPTGEQLSEVFSDYFLMFRPRDIVSGDFYWAIKRNEWLIFCVADCTGHGVPGAFMSLLGISFLNEIVKDVNITSTSEALDELRNMIVGSLKQHDSLKHEKTLSGIKDGMDISLCVLNTITKEMQFSGANNPCWVMKSNGEFIELSADKMPVAIHTVMDKFSKQTVQMNAGDMIYLLSDGFADQFGGKGGKKFMRKNLRELLSSVAVMPVGEQKAALDKAFDEWIAGNHQLDDVTVLGVRV